MMIEAVSTFFVENGYTLELLFSYSLFACFFQRRKYWWIHLILSYGLLLTFSMLWNAYVVETTPVYEYIKYFSMYVIAAFGAFACVKTTILDVLFIVVGGSSTQHCVFRIYSLALSFSGNGYDSAFSKFLNPIFIAVGYSIIFFIFFRKFGNMSEKKMGSPRNILLGIGLFLVTIILHLTEAQYNFMQNEPLIYVLFAAYDIICCVFVLSLQYNIIENNKLQDDNNFLAHLIYKQKEQYKTLKENINLVNIKCHDMKQQISMFENRIDAGALEEIKRIINVYDVSFKTGNEVLDIFFAERGLSFKQHDIQFNCIVDGESLNFIKPSDLYALFGNAFDNAVEALSKLPKEKKLFSITVKRQMNMVIIHMENYYDHVLQFKDGLPQTTKNDTDYHGFGMKSIRLIAEKYKGTITVLAQNGVFNLNILIPIPVAENVENKRTQKA